MAPPNDGPGSIYSRNKADCVEASASFFRLLCDDSNRREKSLSRYVSEDLLVTGVDESLTDHSASSSRSSSPKSSSSKRSSGPKIYSRTSEPTAMEFLKEDFKPWHAYRMHGEPEFVEVDMMSSAVTYRVTLVTKSDEGELEETQAICTSVWKQDAGARWKCCLHHMSRA